VAQEYDEIVEVSIDQQTTALAEPSFSIAAVVALFDEAGISGWVADQRHAYYALDSEMADAGFPVDHIARVKFNAVISQSPNRVEKVLVGREDSLDASMSETLNAIANEQPEFYDVHYTLERKGVVSVAKDFVANSQISFDIVTGGSTLVTVPAFSSSSTNATTYATIKTQIEATLVGSTVTVDDVARTIEIEAVDKAILGVTMSVTGGGSQEATFDIDFEAGNTVNIDVTLGSGSNEDTVIPTIAVPFDSDNATTYAAIETAVELAIAGSIVTVDAGARTVVISMPSQDRLEAVYLVFGGGSQAVATYVTLSPTT